MSDEELRKTAKGNTYVPNVWVTHHDTDWGPHLWSANIVPWDEDYDAPITGWADNTHFVNADRIVAAEARIEALTAKVEMFRETNRRMNRRVQLLEGWWQRRLEREKNQRGTIMWMWCRDRANQPLNVKALEEAAYQRGYEDGRDDRFNIPPRRAKPRRERSDD